MSLVSTSILLQNKSSAIMYNGRSVMEKTYLLNSGYTMPALGLSTYRSRSEEKVYNIIDQALDAGYRLFDTANLFCNEISLRHAFANLLPKYNLERTDIFITSKLIAMDDKENTSIRSVFEKTLARLGLDYLDLYLISSSLQSSMNLKEAWEALQVFQAEGRAASIGVANFNTEQLKYIMEDSAIPAVNQVEFHPLIRNNKLYDFCNEFNIKIQAYSPFGTPFANHKRLFHNRIIKRLAAKYEVPMSQVILMWSLQQDVGVVPSTTNLHHLRENIDFELKMSARDMLRLGSLAPDPNDSDPEV